MLPITKSAVFLRSVIAAAILITAYAATYRFYAMWWFIIALIDLFIGLFYIGIILNSLIFLLTKRKYFTKPYLPLLINIASVVLIYLLPALNRNKNYHKRSFNFSECSYCNCQRGLYTDIYTIYASGATTTDLNAVYITDLKNFRVFIGEYDEGGPFIEIRCKGDTITTSNKSSNSSSLEKTEKKTFSLKKLKADGVFE